MKYRIKVFYPEYFPSQVRYLVEEKPWWSPFWVSTYNTFMDLEGAKQYISSLKNRNTSVRYIYDV